MLQSSVIANPRGVTAVLRPSIVPLALLLALCACSKSDGDAPSQAAPESNTLRPAVEPTQAEVDTAPRMSAVEPKHPEPAAAEASPRPEGKQKASAAPDGANRTRSLAVRRWNGFQAVVQRCVSVPIGEREQCLADARDAYRAAKVDCTALSTRDRKECVKYAKLWQDTEMDVPTAAVTHDEDRAAAPAEPEDADPAERNRDSTQQSQDAAGAAPDEAIQD
jgi:hypothetical protein